MNFEISRITSPDLNSLLKWPRVSHKVSEYVFSYIDENVLKTTRLLQSNRQLYWFTLDFSFSIPVPNRILYKSPFATDKRLFISQKGFRTVEGKRSAFLSVIADDIDQTIKSHEYALVVFDMFADYLTYNYPKLTKSIFERIRAEMDEKYIESFQYPAPFDDQQYALDDSQYGLNPVENLKGSVLISPREEYLKHYPF